MEQKQGLESASFQSGTVSFMASVAIGHRLSVLKLRVPCLVSSWFHKRPSLTRLFWDTESKARAPPALPFFRDVTMGH